MSIPLLLSPQCWQEKFCFSGENEWSLCTDVFHTPKSTLPLKSVPGLMIQVFPTKHVPQTSLTHKIPEKPNWWIRAVLMVITNPKGFVQYLGGHEASERIWPWVKCQLFILGLFFYTIHSFWQLLSADCSATLSYIELLSFARYLMPSTMR